MAFTACYAGQLFNLLIGFGMTLLINSWKQGSMTFDLFGMVDHGQNLDTLMGYMIVVLALLNISIMLIYSLFSKFTYGKAIGIWI